MRQFLPKSAKVSEATLIRQNEEIRRNYIKEFDNAENIAPESTASHSMELDPAQATLTFNGIVFPTGPPFFLR
jgi:hypothetical protein